MMSLFLVTLPLVDMNAKELRITIKERKKVCVGGADNSQYRNTIVKIILPQAFTELSTTKSKLLIWGHIDQT